MIPCLGVLVLNRGDLFLRLIDSIDLPVQRLCVVQNGKDDIVDMAIDQLARGRNPLVQQVYWERPFRNMGVGPAWNSIIKSFPECDYWLIANNDTVFLPGDLAKYHELTQSNDSIIAAANGAFSCFTLTPKIVAEVGLFDENIWPIYSEDVDYYIRAQRAGISRICIPSDVGFSDDGSWTIKSNATYAASNHSTQASNGQYVTDKWGPQLDFQTAWNHPSRDHRDWWYDPYRRKRHSDIWQNFENTANRIL
jgi:GT2 family glycosyltransferase